MRGWLGGLLIALLIATSFKSAIADWYVVPTGSMKPTIIEGDRIFANKLAYDLKIPYTTMDSFLHRAALRTQPIKMTHEI
jgi:signal peptidase I